MDDPVGATRPGARWVYCEAGLARQDVTVVGVEELVEGTREACGVMQFL